MRLRRAWWLLGLLPLAGAMVSLALPPFDEYAALDRVGSRFDPQERFGDDLIFSHAMAAPGRPRGWDLRLSEGAAGRFVDRFASRERGWQEVGSSSVSAVEPERREAAEEETEIVLYSNNETGDSLEFERRTRLTSGRKAVTLTVMVSQSGSTGAWAKIKRWARLTFRR